MDKINLTQKVWYRAVKVLFVTAFIFIQVSGFLLTHSVISTVYPKQKIITSTQVDAMLNKGLTIDKIQAIAQQRGYIIFSEASLQSKSGYLLGLQKLVTYLLVFVSVSLLFLLIARTFFYIICGEKFTPFFVKRKK